VDFRFEVNNTLKIYIYIGEAGCRTFEVEFLENKIYKRYAKKDIYIYRTRQDEDKGRLTAMPSWKRVCVIESVHLQE
jgi:hypothetical protein